MESVGFPISREAACCGIYIYLESTRVGLMSKDALRRSTIKMYEDSYIERFKRRQDKLSQKKSTSEIIPKFYIPVENNSNYEISGLWSAPICGVVDIQNSQHFSLGAFWSIPENLNNAEDDCNWSSHGIELYSKEVTKKVKKTDFTPPVYTTSSHGVDLFSINVSKTEESSIADEIKYDMWGNPISNEDSDLCDVDEIDEVLEESFEWEEDSTSEDLGIETTVEDSQNFSYDDLFEDEESEEDCVRTQYNSYNDSTNENESKSSVPNLSSASMTEHQKVQQVSKEYKHSNTKSYKTVEKPEPVLTRLDENAVRDFIKVNGLCTEQDILKNFSGHDPLKVRSVIKSAARHYKIFEKHGKFTV